MTISPRYSALIERISGRGSKAWDVGDRAFARMQDGHDIIHLGVGDPDLDTSASVRDAAEQALAAGRTHYSPLAGEPLLRKAVAARASVVADGGIDTENVMITQGAQAALFAVFQCIAGIGDEVIVIEPYYATYPAVVTAGGAKMVTVKASEDKGYIPDFARRQGCHHDTHDGHSRQFTR